MIATLEHPPRIHHPLVSAAAEVHRLLDRVETDGPLTAGEHAAAVTE
jgi:hypothetical protein